MAVDRLGAGLAAARMVDGALDDLFVDPGDDPARPLPGTIFRAVADRPMKRQGGMFVRLPHGTGFLRAPGGIAPGACLLVEVTGYAEPGKAVPVTTRLLVRGRHAIVTPGAPGINVARRVKGAARDGLSSLGRDGMAGADDSLGLILRSAAAEADPDDVAAEVLALRDLAERLLGDRLGDPERLLDGPDAVARAAQEWTAPDTLDDAPGAFARHGLDALIAGLARPEVALDGGAGMALERTRALVAVDVNTGADTSPAAALKASVAAARALPRQLRLRGFGGMIVVDFAPHPKRDRARVEQALQAAFRQDTTETVLAGWTPLGNYEIQRRRDRLPLSEILR